MKFNLTILVTLALLAGYSDDKPTRTVNPSQLEKLQELLGQQLQRKGFPFPRGDQETSPPTPESDPGDSPGIIAGQPQKQAPASFGPSRRVAWMLAHGLHDEGLSQIDDLLRNPLSAGLRAEILHFRAVALVVLIRDTEVDSSWEKAIEAAHEAIVPHLTVRSLIARSMWWRKTDLKKSIGFWNAAMAEARKAPASIQLSRVLNLAGVTQSKLGDVQGMEDAWELASERAPYASPIDQSVALNNLGALRLIRAGIDSNPLKSISQAESDLTRALGALPTNAWGTPVRISILLHLARSSDTRDDSDAVNRWSGEFKKWVTTSPVSILGSASSLDELGMAIGTDGLEETLEIRILTPSQAEDDENLFRKPIKEPRTEFNEPGIGFAQHFVQTPIQELISTLSWGEDWVGTHASKPDLTTSAVGFTEIDKQLRDTISDFQNQVINQFRQEKPTLFEGIDRAKKEEFLGLLPGSGRRPCKASALDAVFTAFASQSSEHQIGRRGSVSMISGLYDPERLPADTLLWASMLENSKESPWMGKLGFASSHGRKVLNQLHACGLDRTLWQFSEIMSSDLWDRDRRLREALGKSVGGVTRSRFAMTEAASQVAFMESIRKLERAERVGKEKDFLDSEAVEETNQISERLQKAYNEITTNLAPQALTAARLENFGAVANPGDLYLVIHGAQGYGQDDWYITAIWQNQGVEEPAVLTERLSVPHLLLYQYRQAIAGGPQTVPEIEAVNLGRRVFGRLFPGEIGRQLKIASRITIVPSHGAWLVPYAALVMNSSGQPEYLGLEKQLSFVESKAAFDDVNRPWTRPRGHAAVICGITYNHPDQRTVLSRYGVGSLGVLPDSTAAGGEIARSYEAHTLEGMAAGESKVRDLLNQAPVIHISTHGFSMNGNAFAGRRASEFVRILRSGSAGVWLTPGPASAATNTFADGILQAWEIQHQLELAADLVVLAACEAAKGKETGLIVGPDLPLAFLRAGARSVVAPLNVVFDAPTAKLTLALHSEIRKGLAKDEALRLAMRKVQSESTFRHPVNWAAFQLFGSSKNHFIATTK